jgi:hypothetical protein
MKLNLKLGTPCSVHAHAASDPQELRLVSAIGAQVLKRSVKHINHVLNVNVTGQICLRKPCRFLKC